MKGSMRHTALAAALLTLSSGVLADAEKKKQEQKQEQALPHVEVIGHAFAESAAIRQAAPNAMAVIQDAQLNQFNDLNVGDAVRRLPGVTFSGVNRSRDIRLRGLGKEYTQVLFDGRMMLDGDSTRNLEVDRLPAALVERIEIVRSPLAEMRSQGSAGTVNIMSRRHMMTPGGTLSVGAGRLQGNGPIGDVSLFQGGKLGELRYFVSGVVQHRLLEESSTETVSAYKNGAWRPDKGSSNEDQKRRFNESTFLAGFEYDINATNTLSLTPSYFNAREQRDSKKPSYKADQTLDKAKNEVRHRERETYGARVGWEHDFGDGIQSTLAFDWQKAKEDSVRNGQEYKSNGALDKTTLRTALIALRSLGVSYDIVAERKNHTFKAGLGTLRITRDETESRWENGVYKQPHLERMADVAERVHHAYVSDSMALTPSSQLTLGLRVEQAHTTVSGYDGSNGAKSSTDVNPSVNYRYDLTPQLAWRAGLSRTVRRPDLRDLSPAVVENSGTLAKPDTSGNPNTNPERAWGLDTGFDWYLYDGKGIMSINVFARDFSDKIQNNIVRGSNGRFLSRPYNAGDGRLYGVELEGRLPLNRLGLDNLTLWGNTTLMRSHLSDVLTGESVRFKDQPNVIANIGADWFVPAIDTTFGVNYNHVFAYSQSALQTTGDARDRTEKKAIGRLDFSASTKLSKSVTLSISALNVLGSTDKVTQTTFNTANQPISRTVSEEPTNRTLYVRLATSW